MSTFFLLLGIQYASHFLRAARADSSLLVSEGHEGDLMGLAASARITTFIPTQPKVDSVPAEVDNLLIG
jgi:hypothetical protein